MRTVRICMVVIPATLLPPAVSGACLDDATVAELVAGYPTAPLSGFPTNLNLEEAYCTQAKYVAALSKTMGEPIGYKVSFTGKPTRERFGIPTPAFGVLFAPMFIDDGGTLPLNFGHRPVIEPDLLVIVKDAGIMTATTELEAAAHLSSVHAFIELAAVQFAADEPLTGPALVALNIAATHMVMGPGAAIEATHAFVQALAEVETVFSDETGKVIQNAPTSTLLGNPLRVVLWLVEEFRRRGRTLTAGDRLSLGAVGQLFPLTEGGKTYTYSLTGLPSGPISTSVSIE